ncbi:DUF4251 domain-containing protein [Viscerimonas tarda]
MKREIDKVLVISFLLIVVGITGCKPKELSMDEQVRLDQMKEIVEGQKYTFVATVALPTDIAVDAAAFNLTSRYVFKVSKDTIQADLPYMGKSYMGVPGLTQGIHFVSTDFKYEVKSKGRTIQATFTPNDLYSVRYATLSILTNGTASLIIQENSRSLMRFEGILE